MDKVSVSQVVAGYFCPVRLYLERSATRGESPRYTISKQVSYQLGKQLQAELLWEEVTAIQPDISADMREFLDECVDACKKKEWRRPVQTDVQVGSERFGIRGIVDKIFADEPCFAITRSSSAPPAGVYTGDRIRIACYALCIKESLGLSAVTGLIEYIPSGTTRLCHPEPRDRRAMLQGIHSAQRVLAGEVPRKPVRAPCTSCPYEEKCLPGVQRFSDFM
ncbi:MAG: Dna2/Cas4 domain-containing protein [Methanomicrobiales archaeon]|nr:Dna2/Cas4 domain-containing protein [Methanomicrobiales archaeon]